MKLAQPSLVRDNYDYGESLEYLRVDMSAAKVKANFLKIFISLRTQTNLMMAGIEVLSHSSRFEEEEVYLS